LRASRVWQVFCLLVFTISGLIGEIAEFRGPGVHHNFDDSDSGYDVDMDQKKSFGGGNQRGRIILLGDGTEVLTDSDDTEMFDHSEEDKDLASQVHKGQATSQDEPKSTTQKTDKAVADTTLPKSTETPEKKPVEKNTEN
jgi:protein phosphatase PTC2/3